MTTNRDMNRPFYYIDVHAEDESEAQSLLQECLKNAKCSEAQFHLAFTSPSEYEEEIGSFVFVVFADRPAIDSEEMLHDNYTMPHLVNAPLFDADEF